MKFIIFNEISNKQIHIKIYRYPIIRDFLFKKKTRKKTLNATLKIQNNKRSLSSPQLNFVK